jgi:hypothetical protein
MQPLTVAERIVAAYGHQDLNSEALEIVEYVWSEVSRAKVGGDSGISMVPQKLGYVFWFHFGRVGATGV